MNVRPPASNGTGATTATDGTTPIRVVDGDADIGLLHRCLGGNGHHAICFEAFGLDGDRVGVFPDERSAAQALWRRARGQQSTRPAIADGEAA
jgi:hypothetical protein